jgi:hypothetical protein
MNSSVPESLKKQAEGADWKLAVEAGFWPIKTKTCISGDYFRIYPRPEEYLLDFETSGKRLNSTLEVKKC